MSETPAVALIRILETESELLIEGKLEELKNSDSAKKELEIALTQNPCSADDARLIKRAATVNERLFRAAIKGIKSANTRLNDVAKVRSGLSLYTKDGAKNIVLKSGEAMERKA